ncbi:KICSTOR complex protein SZT2-like [Oncorhynchus mykiss]|uniref:KICSTOR complex protein SZT2-like n=1 Tax=Oncorhynchus mykiss TaxID=8022 RepID=UPI0018783656|nr:KICSTOR complex protein SZT2-like [Oncorhynchus mykiss]
MGLFHHCCFSDTLAHTDPKQAVDLDTLKQSSRLVHYCATPLLFDRVFRKQIQEEQIVQTQHVKKRHHSSDSTATGRDRSYSTDSVDKLPNRLREGPWLQDISNTFLQQYVQYLQSMGFILVQVRPQFPARSIPRARAAMFSSLSSERQSFSYNTTRSEDSPKSTGSDITAYYHQRALPGGIVLMELAFQVNLSLSLSLSFKGGLLAWGKCCQRSEINTNKHIHKTTQTKKLYKFNCKYGTQKVTF